MLASCIVRRIVISQPSRRIIWPTIVHQPGLSKTHQSFFNKATALLYSAAPPARWQSSSGRKESNNPDNDDDPVFGVLRRRVLDKVGDNLDQIMKFNAFELFGIKQEFKVNSHQLQQEMRRLQQILHPDRFVNARKVSQEKSNYLSAAVNDFYTILSNPYERGKYLLSLVLGKSPSDIEKSLDELKLEGDFLSQMMEMQEQINDPTCDTLTLSKLASLLESDMMRLISDLDKDFRSKNTEAILEKLGKLKFLVKCHRRASDRSGTFSRF